jgi:hypothetical protein
MQPFMKLKFYVQQPNLRNLQESEDLLSLHGKINTIAEKTNIKSGMPNYTKTYSCIGTIS